VVDVRWLTAFLDSPTRDAEPFWVAVTGWELSARRDAGTFATLVPGDGDACLRVQVVGTPPPRTHLDLHVAGVPAAVGQAESLGASVVTDQGSLVVMRSPAGLTFCLVEWVGEAVRPAPARWPGGQTSVVDQVCLDVPAGLFDAESRFWAAVTGWTWQPGDLPEFMALARPAGMAVRLLMQRTGSAAAGMHVDFACDDVDTEVARHVALGASVVRRVPDDWTTLLDPVGREYCVTARSPW
jgi:predicted enzyme related to lactoylglutathione lyase